MANVTKLIVNHPLVGTWTSPEDTTVEFTVVSTGAGLSVRGRDRSDGEEFEISQVSWDGETLSFTSVMPSTGHRVRHVMRALPEGKFLEHEYTLTELWHRE